MLKACWRRTRTLERVGFFIEVTEEKKQIKTVRVPAAMEQASKGVGDELQPSYAKTLTPSLLPTSFTTTLVSHTAPLSV